MVPFDGAALNTPDLPLTTVYGDTGNSGQSAALGLGSYTTAQLQAKGVADDSISSIALPPGYKISAYSADNFTGTPWSFTANNGDLRNTGNTSPPMRRTE